MYETDGKTVMRAIDIYKKKYPQDKDIDMSKLEEIIRIDFKKEKKKK